MEMMELTLEKFEEASEIVEKVTQETKLIYSEYFSGLSGNKELASTGYIFSQKAGCGFCENINLWKKDHIILSKKLCTYLAFRENSVRKFGLFA